MSAPDREAIAKAFEKAERETARLIRELDITNADHVALWLEAHIDQEIEHLGWLACRIVDAHEAALRTQPATGLSEQTDVERVKAALEPVMHWYQSDEHPERPLADTVADVVADLQQDRAEVLRLERMARAAIAALSPERVENERLRELLANFQWRARQCRTNRDAYDEKAAFVWEFAAKAVEAKLC